MRTKKILAIQPVAERGGSDYALLRMARRLATDGWECHVAFPGPPPLAAEFAAAGAGIHVVPMRRLTGSGGAGYWAGYVAMWPVSVLRLWRLGRRVRPDVVHSNSSHSWYGWAVAWLLGVPHVWHAREIVVQSKWALRVERALAKHFAWRVVAVSAAVARQFDSDNVVVVHDALSPEDGYSPWKAGHFRAQAGINDDVVLVGAAGRLDTWKGFDVLLEAFPRVRRLRPGTELAVAGGAVRGKERYAEALAATARKTEAVHWLGPMDDMASFMADLDLFVLPSTEPEPFGLVALEALASGDPVVLTDQGGATEILENCPSNSGKLSPPKDPAALADAIVAMLPEGPSSVEQRRARASHLVGDPTGTVKVFDQALEHAKARSPRTRRGTPQVP